MLTSVVLHTRANTIILFGAVPHFEDVSVRFANGNHYGLIGAKGRGKSTFMKTLDADRYN